MSTYAQNCQAATPGVVLAVGHGTCVTVASAKPNEPVSLATTNPAPNASAPLAFVTPTLRVAVSC